MEGDLLFPIDIQLRYSIQYFTVESNMLGFPKSCSSEMHLLVFSNSSAKNLKARADFTLICCTKTHDTSLGNSNSIS